MKLEDLFAQLHLQLGQTLLDKIMSGEATASELNVARQFLKDNGIDGIPKKENPLGQLAQHLPLFDDETTEADLPQRH